MKEKKKANQPPIPKSKDNESERKEKNEEIEQIYKETAAFDQPKKESRIGQVIVIAIIFGLIAGILGEIIFRAFLIDLPFFSSLNYSNQISPGQEIIIKEPKNVVVEQDTRTGQVVENLQPSIVDIYIKKTDGKAILDKIYLPADLAGQGLVITSDGWVMTTRDVIKDSKKIYSARLASGKDFDVSEFIADPITNLIFFKIKTDNLSSAKFAGDNSPTSGQIVLALNSLKTKLFAVESPNYQRIASSGDALLSSEKFSKYILINNAVDQDYMGAPLLNMAGEVVGIMTKNDAVGMRIALPSNYAESAIASILKNKKVSRAYLGVHYLDLSQTVGLDSSLSNGLAKGALLAGNDTVASVEANSPAKKSSLKAGDIILKVEDEEINSNNDLTELVQKYKTGDIIDLTISRDKAEKTLKVELSEIK
jgi:S1-C subfamily serine protease